MKEESAKPTMFKRKVARKQKECLDYDDEDDYLE